MARKVAATTVGCKVNAYDTRALLQRFADAGYEIVDFAGDDAADVCIINTCCVTNAADKKSRQAVRRAVGRGARVAVMGCASQAAPQKYAEIGADIVVGTANRGGILAHLADLRANSVIIDVKSLVLAENGFEAAHVDEAARDKTRGFLKIQDGCDNFCTFCIIPNVRGAPKSRAFADVMAQARRFAELGCKEIVVAGICVASYGKDFKGQNLVSVLREICAIGVCRVRLSSVAPCAITPEFLDFVAGEPKFCDHLHLSLQSGSDRILAAMNRKYTTAQFAHAVAQLRRALPDISITTDVIAGFPGETLDDHRQTLDFAAEMRFAAMHVFPFSAKDGTAAARLGGQIPAKVRNARAKEVREVGKQLTNAHYGRFVGRTMPVLVESRNAAGFYEGKTANYIPVYFEAQSGLEGEIINIRLDAHHDGGIFGLQNS